MNRINMVLSILLLLSISLGCLGPGTDSDRCIGTVRSNGKEFIGKSKDTEQAGLNACNKFCLETDKEFEAMYQIWLSSERAKELEQRDGKKVSKQEAIFENKRLLDYITKNCAIKCKTEANKGKHILETKCRQN